MLNYFVVIKILRIFVFMDSKPRMFSPRKIKVSDEFEVLRVMVFMYSSYRKASRPDDPKCKVLRPKLIDLLCLYIMHGYNKETKEKANAVLELNKKEYLNSMNLELRKQGFLIQDKYNTRINHLNPALEKMKEYHSLGEDPFLFLVQIGIDDGTDST